MTLKYENVSKTIFMLEPCRMNQKLIIPDAWRIKKNYKDTGFEFCYLQYSFSTNNSAIWLSLQKTENMWRCRVRILLFAMFFTVILNKNYSIIWLSVIKYLKEQTKLASAKLI